MEPVDLVILALYFAVMVGVGLWFARRAAASLESYFLGGRRLPWWALAMSGSVSNFDITGTMWIVSMLVVLGLRSMWIHWMWGFLAGAFLMVYMARWMRRSGVMTAAEWMKTRFGEDAGGRAARATSAAMALLVTIAAIGYAFQGIGKFTAVYVPLAEWTDPGSPLGAFVAANEAAILASAIMGLTTLYVLCGGLFSVVVTDVLQTVILTGGSIVVAFVAWQNLTPEALARLPSGFTSLAPCWQLGPGRMGHGTEHELFGAFALVWVCKGLLLNLGGPAQLYDAQRFLAAKDEREAAKVGAAWSLFLVVRWGMAMGIALLALCVVTERGGDPEQVMPVILRDFVPAGVRGLILAGLLAAFMSTFSSTVNSGAAIAVKDVWQPLVGDRAGARQSLLASYVATMGLVAAGIAFGVQGKSIHAIWQWMMLALTGGVVVPNVLRWYWWRMNGWGYTLGTAAGALPAIALLLPEDRLGDVIQLPYVSFPLIVASSTLGCVVGSLVTKPTEARTLEAFYRRVRPFGAWGALGIDLARRQDERAGRAAGNVALAGLAIAALYLLPMYLVGHRYAEAGICALVVLATVATLRVTWYRHLPAAEPDAPEAP